MHASQEFTLSNLPVPAFYLFSFILSASASASASASSSASALNIRVIKSAAILLATAHVWPEGGITSICPTRVQHRTSFSINPIYSSVLVFSYTRLSCKPQFPRDLGGRDLYARTNNCFFQFTRLSVSWWVSEGRTYQITSHRSSGLLPTRFPSNSMASASASVSVKGNLIPWPLSMWNNDWDAPLEPSTTMLNISLGANGR